MRCHGLAFRETGELGRRHDIVVQSSVMKLTFERLVNMGPSPNQGVTRALGASRAPTLLAG